MGVQRGANRSLQELTSLWVLPVIFLLHPGHMVCLNLIRRFNGREAGERLFLQLKQTKGFGLHSWPSVNFQSRRLGSREPPEVNVEAQCGNGDAIWGKGGKVRVGLELLWSLHPLRCVLHFPNDLQLEGKCDPMLARGDLHSHTGFWSRIPGEVQSLSPSEAQMRLHSRKMWEHWDELQMGADKAQRPGEAADGCSHREGSWGAEGGSGKAVQGKGDWESLQVHRSRARGKPENHSDLDLRTNGTVRVVATMCEQARGTLHATEPGVLELRSRKSSSRMLSHKSAVMYVPEPCSLLEQATMVRLPQSHSVLLHCPEQPGSWSCFPTSTHLLATLKVWRPESCYVLCSSKPSASTMPGRALCQGEGLSLARWVRGMASLGYHSPIRSSLLQHPGPFWSGPKKKKKILPVPPWCSGWRGTSWTPRAQPVHPRPAVGWTGRAEVSWCPESNSNFETTA